MSDGMDNGSAEPTANPEPKAMNPRQAAQILAARKTELRQAPQEAPPEPAPEPESVQNAEPAPNGTDTAQTAEGIDYSTVDYSAVAGFTEPERNQDQMTGDVTPEPSFTLKHDGQERTVNRQEAIDLAQMGLDYRVKTQNLAEDRRALESERKAISEQMAGLQEDRQRLQAELAKFSKQLTPPDPALAEEDPDAFNLQMARYQRDRAELDKSEAEQAEIRRKDQEQAQERARAEFARQQEILHARVPAMAQQKTAHEVGRYLTQGLGFSGEELIRGWVGSADARFQEMAFKAWQFDMNRTKAQKLREQPPRSVSGSNKRSGAGAGQERKQGVAISPREAAAIISGRKRR